jgi:hypothetical protein
MLNARIRELTESLEYKFIGNNIFSNSKVIAKEAKFKL